ncbi:hypothetical protein RMATCC62417_11195 [Rhizopus microsporus]|nr:hypothetical protein RMATCC62417_11195 [Rhizopus microsporus]
MSTILEKARRLAVYCLATRKELDRDAKSLLTKTLRLPDSLKYLEDDDEDDNKDIFFSPEAIEKIQRARFLESVIKRFSSSSRTHGVPHTQQRSTPVQLKKKPQAQASEPGLVRLIGTCQGSENNRNNRKSDKTKDNRNFEMSTKNNTLHDFRGWDPTRQSSTEIFTQLETIDEAPMALIRYQRRLSNPISDKISPLEDREVQLVGRRSNGS